MPYIVYILECADGTYYTGSTTDIVRRLREHNSSGRGARYTKSRRPVVLKYAEELRSLSEARSREAEIKRLSRKGKNMILDLQGNKISPGDNLIN
jgi:putative endonuclease